MNRNKVTGISLALAAAGLATGCASTAPHSGTLPVATGAPAHQAAATAAGTVVTPAPSPSPAGNGSGSCDYTLSNSVYGNDHLIGEVDLTSTGNVGAIVRVTIKWPQEGYAPITATKTVHMPYNAKDLPVRFHVAVPTQGNVISQLQSWEENHNFPGNACKYRQVITGTYGRAH